MGIHQGSRGGAVGKLVSEFERRVITLLSRLSPRAKEAMVTDGSGSRFTESSYCRSSVICK